MATGEQATAERSTPTAMAADGVLFNPRTYEAPTSTPSRGG